MPPSGTVAVSPRRRVGISSPRDRDTEKNGKRGREMGHRLVILEGRHGGGGGHGELTTPPPLRTVRGARGRAADFPKTVEHQQLAVGAARAVCYHAWRMDAVEI